VLSAKVKPLRNRWFCRPLFGQVARISRYSSLSTATSLVLECMMSFSSSSWAQAPVCSSTLVKANRTQAGVLTLRPQITFWKETYSSKSQSEGESDEVRAELHWVLSQTFEDEAYMLRLGLDQIADWEQTSPNAASVKALQRDYDSLVRDSTSSQLDCGRYLKASLRDDLQKLTDNDQFDVVIFSRGGPGNHEACQT
jgi:hypothetical protein